MNLTQIEKSLKDLVEYHNPLEFIYDLLSAYNLPKATVTRLRKGNSNLSKNQSEVILKNKAFFKEELTMDLHVSISTLEKNHKHNERFLIVTDWNTFLAIDTKTKDKLDTDFKDLPKHYDFFLPWAGMEKIQHANENPADVKAAEKMAKLFDAIKQNNPDDSEEFVHSLNVFLSRLLFCFFAEDTNIFEENQFTNSISSHTQPDGSDLDNYLDKLFEVLNTPPEKRENLPSYLDAFPYVNGGLFKDKLKVPKFNRKARQSIIDSGELNWSDINPDIFGSMFQAVIDVDQRGSLGQHYTSIPNIMKVIEPLFLNELKDQFESAQGSRAKLNDLLKRLQKIKVFDPACGSGNFLIIAYKELRRVEIEVLEELKRIQGDAGTVSLDFGADYLSHISLNNFYGIELDDFAHEIAKLALWLAEHQMNQEFFKAIGKSNPTLPLRDAGNINQGNATRKDWSTICPISKNDELYVLGNPPYLGYARQTIEQKEDMAEVFSGFKDYKRLDYICCWFYKAGKYVMNTKAKFAFVTTNSITQGEQVSLLWPLLFKLNLEIFFAHKSFKWQNNAKSNAGVSVVIIGIQDKLANNNKKPLFFKDKIQLVGSISPYLIPNAVTIVEPRSTPISKGLPKMIKGSSPGDNGNLILNEQEKNEILKANPNISKFIKPYVGAKEFMYNESRYCIWVEENEISEASKHEDLSKRFDKVKEFRLNSSKAATRAKAQYPYLFDERKYDGYNSILIPQTGSERREYLPIGFCDEETVISNGARIIPNAQPWIFSILSSKMHIIWVKAVAGRLKMDMQYSNTLCYNTFPLPSISKLKQEELTTSALRLIAVREQYSQLTMAQLYDPDNMPQDLRDIHNSNDEIVDKCYRNTVFHSDEERLEFLFGLYDKMVLIEINSTTLFAEQKKTKKKK